MDHNENRHLLVKKEDETKKNLQKQSKRVRSMKTRTCCPLFRKLQSKPTDDDSHMEQLGLWPEMNGGHFLAKKTKAIIVRVLNSEKYWWRNEWLHITLEKWKVYKLQKTGENEVKILKSHFFTTWHALASVLCTCASAPNESILKGGFPHIIGPMAGTCSAHLCLNHNPSHWQLASMGPHYRPKTIFNRSRPSRWTSF